MGIDYSERYVDNYYCKTDIGWAKSLLEGAVEIDSGYQAIVLRAESIEANDEWMEDQLNTQLDDKSLEKLSMMLDPELYMSNYAQLKEGDPHYNIITAFLLTRMRRHIIQRRLLSHIYRWGLLENFPTGEMGKLLPCWEDTTNCLTETLSAIACIDFSETFDSAFHESYCA